VWKVQNKSLPLFSGEEYNVEMGISYKLFQTERDETTNCQFAPLPNDITNTDGATGVDTLSGIETFAFFTRFLAPPIPSFTAPGGADSIASGRTLFQSIGCAYCHTPQLRTGNAAVAALASTSISSRTCCFIKCDRGSPSTLEIIECPEMGKWKPGGWLERHLD
jgi:CxxC motif-containing protein (DUF1111 family)